MPCPTESTELLYAKGQDEKDHLAWCLLWGKEPTGQRQKHKCKLHQWKYKGQGKEGEILFNIRVMHKNLELGQSLYHSHMPYWKKVTEWRRSGWWKISKIAQPKRQSEVVVYCLKKSQSRLKKVMDLFDSVPSGRYIQTIQWSPEIRKRGQKTARLLEAETSGSCSCYWT